jgi:threonyl-tRNA synthetase
MERFVAFLIEKNKGAFPAWLAPVQVKFIQVSYVHDHYDKKVETDLRKSHIRVEVDGRDEKIGYKIREAQTLKIPYMLVVGDQEIEKDAVNVRRYGEKESASVGFESFMDQLKAEIEEHQ